MNDELLTALNDQISLEYASSYAYLQMAAWAHQHDLTGTAAWLQEQSAEELHHAHKFIDFVLDRDGAVRLQALNAPRSISEPSWTSSKPRSPTNSTLPAPSATFTRLRNGSTTTRASPTVVVPSGAGRGRGVGPHDPR